MSITADSYIKWSPYCIWDEFDDARKIVVLRLTKINKGEGIYIHFDSVTANLWKMFNGTKSVSSILENLVPNETNKSIISKKLILQVLEKFLDTGLIELSNKYQEISNIVWQGHERVYRLNCIDWRVNNKTLAIINNSTGFLVELGKEYHLIWCKINDSNTVNEISYQLTAGHQNVTFVQVRLKLRYLNYLGIISVAASKEQVQHLR